MSIRIEALGDDSEVTIRNCRITYVPNDEPFLEVPDESVITGNEFVDFGVVHGYTLGEEE